MACLLRFLLFYVFYGVYLGAVSVFGDVVLLFGDTPMILYGDLYHESWHIYFSERMFHFTGHRPRYPGARVHEIGKALAAVHETYRVKSTIWSK